MGRFMSLATGLAALGLLAAGEAPSEVAVQVLPLAPPADHRRHEFSGLAWYADTLLLLPQNIKDPPYELYALRKADIDAFLSGAVPGPLAPDSIPLDLPGGFETWVPGYDGLEAVAVRGRSIYLAIEAEVRRHMFTWVVAGRITGSLRNGSARITLDSASFTQVPLTTDIHNLSVETLLLTPEGLLAINEVNGANTTAKSTRGKPEARAVDVVARTTHTVPMDIIEYRLTDATDLDATGRFWAINYFLPRDAASLDPATDQLTATHGQGPTHARSDIVERLVEFKVTPSGITRVRTTPIQLVLRKDGQARN